MGTNDKYRRDSLDGGTTWGDPYQFRGADGKNGSDANVTFDNMLKALQKAESTKTSFITADEVGAPTIYGAKIYGAEIYAGGVGEKGGQIIGLTDRGMTVYDGSGNKVLSISATTGGAYVQTDFNYLTFDSPYFNFAGFSSLKFIGQTVDFSEVQHFEGLHATFA